MEIIYIAMSPIFTIGALFGIIFICEMFYGIYKSRRDE